MSSKNRLINPMENRESDNLESNDVSSQQATIDNPYWVLGVSQGSSRSEIIKAQMQAMKKKQYPVKVIAEAQKALMNPEKRILADFLLPCLSPIMRYRREDLSLLDQPVESLQPLARYVEMDPSLKDLAKQESWDEQAFLSTHVDLTQLAKLTYATSPSPTTPYQEPQSEEAPKASPPKRIFEALKNAQIAFKRKDYTSVINYLAPIQSYLSPLHEKSSIAWMMLAKSYVMINQYDKAFSICRSLLDSPNDEIRSWSQIVMERLQSKLEVSN